MRVFAGLGIGVGVIASAIFGGYVFSVLWGWFVVPVLGVPELSLAPAMGLMLIVGYLILRVDQDKDEDEEFSEYVTRILTKGVIRSLLVLFLGWVIHLFV